MVAGGHPRCPASRVCLRGGWRADPGGILHKPVVGDRAGRGGRPAADERQQSPPAIADRRELILSHDPPLRARTRAAGLFLFLPLLAEIGFDKLVAKADYPGTKMVPCDAALLSLLALKLLRKERLSHIDDFNMDQALGLFAGLNVLPKKSFVTDYSYRTQRQQQQRLLGLWVKKLSPLLMPEATAFSLQNSLVGNEQNLVKESEANRRRFVQREREI